MKLEQSRFSTLQSVLILAEGSDTEIGSIKRDVREGSESAAEGGG